METLRRNGNYISLGLALVTLVFTIGVYATNVKSNLDDIAKIEREIKTCNENAVQTARIAAIARQKAIESFDYNKKLETLTLDVRSRLASIETDIKWIKQSLKDSNNN